MSSKNRVHLVYTLQIKVNGTKQSGEPQIEDLMDSIDGTLKAWFPKGQVQLEKHDVSGGDKRVIITNVLPVVARRSPKFAVTTTATEAVAASGSMQDATQMNLAKKEVEARDDKNE